MTNVLDFIRWALTHVNPNTVPSGAVLANGTATNVGAEPWHYLYGTVRTKTTQSRIAERWKNYYSSHGWAKASYDNATAGMQPDDYATDCQGLLDAYLTYVQGEKTDVNADYNYRKWCTGKGKTSEIERPYELGEAVFMANAKGRITHVGWICGLDSDGEPLVIEARGLSYGVVITRLEDRAWTHRGLMTKKFDYKGDEPMAIKFEVIKPMLKGDGVKAMQNALNVNGYTDDNGNALEEDGKWGSKSQAAFRKLLEAHTQESEIKVTVNDAEMFSWLIKHI